MGNSNTDVREVRNEVTVFYMRGAARKLLNSPGSCGESLGGLTLKEEEGEGKGRGRRG